jgi:hypothetical protein
MKLHPSMLELPPPPPHPHNGERSGDAQEE